LSDLIKSRDVVENILLAKKYRVKQWLRDGYMNLILQTEPVKIDELHSSNVDLLTIARICSIRETMQVKCCCVGECRKSRNAFLRLGASTEITKHFVDEMKEMEDFEDICPQLEIPNPEDVRPSKKRKKNKKKDLNTGR
jgi:hypothetical protein